MRRFWRPTLRKRPRTRNAMAPIHAPMGLANLRGGQPSNWTRVQTAASSNFSRIHKIAISVNVRRGKRDGANSDQPRGPKKKRAETVWSLPLISRERVTSFAPL